MSFFDFFKKPDPKRSRYTVYTYRTQAGLDNYKFSYHKIHNGYEIDIHLMPEIPNHLASGAHTIHTLPSNRDTEKKICVAHKHTPKTMEKAQKLSMEWAELIEAYIKTGITPDDQIAMRN